MRRQQEVTYQRVRSASDHEDEATRFKELLDARDHERAFALLSGSAGRLRGYLRLRFESALGGRLGVEEVVSSAITTAIDRGETYRPELGAPGFWLWRIGVNLARDEMRRIATRRRHEKVAAERAPSVSDPKLIALRGAVREAIMSLSDQRHRSILLWDLEHGGLAPAAAIAKKLELAEQTVLNLRSEARRLVKPKLVGVIPHGT